MKVLETERLFLRPFVLEDGVGLHQEIYSDSEVVRYYSGKGVLTPEATLQHLTEHLASWRDEELGRHAVVLKENGTFLGQVHLNGYVNSFLRWSDEPSPAYNCVCIREGFRFGSNHPLQILLILFPHPLNQPCITQAYTKRPLFFCKISNFITL